MCDSYHCGEVLATTIGGVRHGKEVTSQWCTEYVASFVEQGPHPIMLSIKSDDFTYMGDGRKLADRQNLKIAGEMKLSCSEYLNEYLSFYKCLKISKDLHFLLNLKK